MSILIPFTGLIPVIILVVIGLLIKYKKAYWLISGYNTMPAEKKKNVDIEGLARLTANVCFIIAGIVLVAFILMFTGKMVAFVAVLVLIFPVIIYTLIKAQRYDGNALKSDGKMKTGTKISIGLVVAILVLLSVGIGVLMHFSGKPAEYALQNGVLSISGMYGQDIAISEISSLELNDEIPEILIKTNGSALGTMLKGYFKLKDIGKAKLFIDASKPPFIYIKINSITMILNCEDGEKTKALYEKLRTEWQKSTKKVF